MMEEINLRMKQSCTHGHFSSSSPCLAIHKDSKTVSKVSTNNKPKIRIIHIFAPEIIKTDVENFRELVQRLTGKPTHEKGDQCSKKNIMVKPKSVNKIMKRSSSPSPSPSSSLDDIHNHFDQDSKTKLASFPIKPTSEYMKSSGFCGFDYIARSDQRVKEEEVEEVEAHNGMWDINVENNINISSSGGFLEGFIGFEELGEFPNLLPNLDASHVMQFGFGGPQLV